MTDDPRPPIKLLILGNGTFAMEVTDLLSDIAQPRYEVVGYVASLPPFEPGTTILGRPVYWVDELVQFDDSHRVICALASTKRYLFARQAQEMGMRFVTMVHPTARVSRTATIGQGTVISAGAIVASHTVIGNHVVVNRGALIGHHIKIGNCVTVSPGANLAGAVTVGERTYVGMGATILEKRCIGAQCIVGAGAVVTKDVPDRVKVMGIPARIVEEDIEGL
jgi:sugar O-acyltransferase (sialic acid O-acetyltransferase NeuD family)